MPGHIVALGGGGFSMEPDNPLLDDFILSLSRRRPARVCFIPTASADSATYLVKFYRAFSGRCVPTDLTIFDSPVLRRQPERTADLKAFVSAQDVFYVGGGSTANVLSLWRAHGLDRLLAKPGGQALSLPASVRACCAGSRTASRTRSAASSHSGMVWASYQEQPARTMMESLYGKPPSAE
jgi:peptidase E